MNHQQRLVSSYVSLALNEQGLRYLRDREYEKAIMCFHDGLRLLLEDCPDPAYLQTNCSWTWRDILLVKAAQDTIMFGLATHENYIFSASSHLKPEQDIHDEILICFDRALSVRVEILHKLSDKVIQNLLVGIYVFNAGLAFHLRALSTGSGSSLSKAVEHYAIGYTRFLFCSNYYGKDVSLTLGLLALSNNIAHIHACCRDMEQIGKCVDELARELSKFATVSSGFQHDNDRRIFLQNVCFFQESIFCSAPAA